MLSALTAVSRLRTTLRAGQFPANVRRVLTEIFKNRRFNLAVPEDALAVEAAQGWGEVLAELEAAVKRFPGLASSEVWELALRAFGDSQRFDEKPAGAVELQGWLELLWRCPSLGWVAINEKQGQGEPEGQMRSRGISPAQHDCHSAARSLRPPAVAAGRAPATRLEAKRERARARGC